MVYPSGLTVIGAQAPEHFLRHIRDGEINGSLLRLAAQKLDLDEVPEDREELKVVLFRYLTEELGGLDLKEFAFILESAPEDRARSLSSVMAIPT
jgi:hypothetical protein